LGNKKVFHDFRNAQKFFFVLFAAVAHGKGGRRQRQVTDSVFPETWPIIKSLSKSDFSSGEEEEEKFLCPSTIFDCMKEMARILRPRRPSSTPSFELARGVAAAACSLQADLRLGEEWGEK
jgi:hypothetical protein